MTSPPNRKVGETVIASHEQGSSIKFHELLLALDERAAARVREAGCPRCGGPLYAAHYARKVRGISDDTAEAGHYDVRFSLCCGREGCRARATPPSTRFSGRRVYATLAVLVLSLSPRAQAEAVQSVSAVAKPRAPARSTRERWLCWWRAGLFSAPWFSAMCAWFAEPADAAHAPETLLSKFTGALHTRIVDLVVWLSPHTTTSLEPERSRIAMER